MPKSFTKNDPRINRNGRPKKEFSLSQGLRDFMSKKDPDSKKKYRDIFTQKVMEMALGGDIAAIKLIFNYVDGTPQPVINMPDDDIPKGVEVHFFGEDGKYTQEEVDSQVRQLFEEAKMATERREAEIEEEIERRVRERLKQTM